MRLRTTLAASAAALTLGTGAAWADPVTVGLITTLSGGGAGIGTDIRDGFQLALTMAGGDAIHLVVEDDGQRPEQAVQIADRMIQSERADILTGIIFSNLAMAVVPSVVAQDVFYVSPNAGPSPLAGAGCNPLYFNAAWQNDMLHEASGAYAGANGMVNTFILAPNYPAGTDALTGFKRRYTGTVAGEIYTQLGQTDYAAEIAQIRASGADSVFIFLPGGMGISFMRQYAQSGVGIPVISTAFTVGQDNLPAMGDAALSVINSGQWAPDTDNDANRAFVTAFRAAYGRTPSIYASQSYDTANLILSAIAAADVEDRDAFRAALRAADFTSVRGDFAFGNNQHPIQDVYMRQVVMADGEITNRTLGLAIEDYQDVFAAQCTVE